MERQSNEHSPRIDDAMAHEVAPFVRDTPLDSQNDTGLHVEAAADDESSQAAIGHAAPSETRSGALSTADIRRRSELAQHLRPSIFPATLSALIECARSEDASSELLEELTQLPAAIYQTTEDVWEALGGDREVRENDLEATKPADPDDMAQAAPASPTRFPFRFDRVHRMLGLPFGVTPGTAYVEVDPVEGRLVARFGPWRVATALSNIEHASVTGPYFPPKTVGPAHLSISDRGLTFATNDERGVCIGFRDPVTGIDPRGFVHHPALTVTVADTEALLAALE